MNGKISRYENVKTQAKRISVYIDDNTMRKLEDLKRKLEAGMLAEVSVSRAVTYAIVKAWQVEFQSLIAPLTEQERALIEKYAPQGVSNEREQSASSRVQ